MNELEIQNYVTNRIRSSWKLAISIRYINVHDKIAKSKYNINSPKDIDRIAKSFTVLYKRGIIPPIATSCYVYVTCDDHFGFYVIGNDVYLPVSDGKQGSMKLEIGWSFLKLVRENLDASELDDFLLLESAENGVREDVGRQTDDDCL